MRGFFHLGHFACERDLKSLISICMKTFIWESLRIIFFLSSGKVFESMIPNFSKTFFWDSIDSKTFPEQSFRNILEKPMTRKFSPNKVSKFLKERK